MKLWKTICVSLKSSYSQNSCLGFFPTSSCTLFYKLNMNIMLAHSYFALLLQSLLRASCGKNRLEDGSDPKKLHNMEHLFITCGQEHVQHRLCQLACSQCSHEKIFDNIVRDAGQVRQALDVGNRGADAEMEQRWRLVCSSSRPI
jgi:hypothetical protein